MEFKPGSGRGGRRDGAGRKPRLNGVIHAQVKRRKSSFYFYVLCEIDGADVLKIGIAKSPTIRLVNHQSSNWRTLSMPAVFACGTGLTARALEAFVGAVLEPSQVSGEWYRTTLGEVEAIIAAFSAASGLLVAKVGDNDLGLVLAGPDLQ